MTNKILNHPHFRLLSSIVFFFLIVSFSYKIFLKFKMKYETHNTERLTEILVKNTSFDILFIGSSRTHFSINPSIIDSICGFNSYNLGIEGGDMYEFEMMLKAYLVHHPAPKYLVLNLDMHSFTGDQKIYNYPLYLPFYSKNEVIKSYLSTNGYYKRIYDFFPFLAFSDFDDNTKGFFIKGLLGKTEVYANDFQYKGYISNTDNEITDSNFNFPSQYLSISEFKVNCLNRLIFLCKKSNINVLFTYAPEYKQSYQNSVSNKFQIFSLINSIAKANNIPFIRDDTIKISSDPQYFANVTHLNKLGAKIYSSDFSFRLNYFLNRNQTVK